jgi:hypothetical protein
LGRRGFDADVVSLALIDLTVSLDQPITPA